VELVTAPVDASRESFTATLIDGRHSRIPVYEGSVDNVLGFVSAKEFLLNPQRGVRELLKPVAFFPESAKVDRVFRHMQKNRINLVVVVNEYGETVGILTMEDIVEEIVGEVYDEFDSTEQLIHEIAPGRWFVRCRAPIEEVNDACGLSIPETEAITLNGYLCDEFGEIPARGRVIERAGARFTIEESSRRRIISCRVERLDAIARRPTTSTTPETGDAR